MIWQLLQVRHMDDTPLILLGPMWTNLVAWARENMLSFEPVLASSEDLEIPICTASADEAIALIRKYHAKWVG